MNYDLFIPPQAADSVVVVSRTTVKRPAADGTRGENPTPRTEQPADVFTGTTAREEVSSDEKTAEKVRNAVELVNRLFDQSPVDLNLSIDEETNSLVIKLVERESRKVIRQVPPDEILRLRKHLQELLGVVFDETV